MRYVSRVRPPGLRSALAVAFVLAVAAPAIGQGGPVKRDCDNLPPGQNESKAERINAKLDCRTENLNVELDNLVDQAADSDMFSDKAEAALQHARDHAHRARERTQAAGTFKGLGRKQKSDCYFQEASGVDGNEDGICTTRGNAKETCAEVIGDGIGNDDGLCETTGNRKEACVEVCDTSSNDQDDDNFDEEAAGDVEIAMLDLESSLSDTNKQLAAAIKAYNRAKERALTGTVDSDACLEEPWGWATLVTAALVDSKTVAEYVFDVCSTVCGNDVAGFNCKAGCAGPATAKFILAMLVNLSDQIEEVLTKDGYTIQYSCQSQTSAAVGDVSMSVDALSETAGNTEEAVNDLKEKVDALDVRLTEVIELLNTPPGQRPEFPKK